MNTENPESKAIVVEGDEPTTLKITDAAQAHAVEHGVDLSMVEGTGKDGAILKSDVEAAIPEPVTLPNGSKVGADTLMQCGRCGARFYAKDAPDGSCPATATDQGGAVITCGGVLGPIEA